MGRYRSGPGLRAHGRHNDVERVAGYVVQRLATVQPRLRELLGEQPVADLDRQIRALAVRPTHGASVTDTASEAEALGRAFRQAWINGVISHYPGEPKPGYVAPWDETPEWEKGAATAVAVQIRAFVAATDGAAGKLTAEQKGRFVALCWIGQIFKHIEDPKPSYVADWEDLPDWQKATDIEIFEAISRTH